MSYLARLHALKAEKPLGEKPSKRSKPGIEGFEGCSPKPISGNSLSTACAAALSDPIAWSAALAALDTSRAPTGIDLGWWQLLVTDARWLARNHGEAAAALGWNASDLFGIVPSWGPGRGGVADRLNGTRRLVFTASVAHWQCQELDGWLWRQTLDPKLTLWEIGGRGR